MSSENRNILILIKEVKTGMISTEVWKDWSWNVYWWEEGNASCDCNRSDFFNKALGRAEEDSNCSSDEFLVHIADEVTGEVLYSEFDPPNAKDNRAGEQS